MKCQYDKDWEHETLTEFSFEDGCKELKIEVMTTDFEGVAQVKALNDKQVTKFMQLCDLRTLMLL